MVSTKLDLATRTLLTTRILEASDREVARMASLSLPQTGTWLNCPPLPALRLRLQTLSLLLPPSLSWECLIKLGQATASVNWPTHLQIKFRSHSAILILKCTWGAPKFDPPFHEALDWDPTHPKILIKYPDFSTFESSIKLKSTFPLPALDPPEHPNVNAMTMTCIWY